MCDVTMSRLAGLSLILLLAAATTNACTRLSRVVKPWTGGFQGEFSLPVSQGISTWSARLEFEHGVNKLEIWTAQATKENDKTFILKPTTWNGNVGAGQTLKMEFVVHYSDGSATSTNPCLTFFPGQASPGDSSNVPATSPPVDNKPQQPVKPAVPGNNGKIETPGAKYNYDEALYKALLFYEAQRSGKLPADKLIDWRGDSELNDGKDVGRDLTGGWHDAGDHVKFGLPMASSATMLLYGLEFIKDGYEFAGQYGMGLRQVRWALEYFRKCYVDKDRFYAQVADGDADHSWWGRPEDNYQHRPTFTIGGDKPKGGADIMGETAAAMAAGYVVFKDVDAGFANGLLSDAKQLYNLGKKNPGTANSIIPKLHKFYNSDAWEDEMAHAAAWLAYAVGSDSGEYQGYLGDAKNYFKGGEVPWSLSWSEKRPAVAFMLYKLTGGEYKSDIENFLKEWLPGGSLPRTPKGLVWRDKWGSNRYAANAAMLALLAAKNGINTKQYYDFAASQINFMLGDAGRSYVVGFGHNYPQRAHHKAASCPWKPAPCGWNEYNSWSPNPHVLDGALVGGPGELSGNFVDDRSKFEFTEVATDYNAGFTSALAGMKYFAARPAS
ncbi:hypothetical protein EB796_008716 [Bugula neritina]|uniref:Endoglucanase n=1 Tax=Bugula neritina TaxID=10212 RepID=A0A7J7K4Z5_BUGNE|nr:hypothetical protein EB796_008716 [Bugula neritina]